MDFNTIYNNYYFAMHQLPNLHQLTKENFYVLLRTTEREL